MPEVSGNVAKIASQEGEGLKGGRKIMFVFTHPRILRTAARALAVFATLAISAAYGQRPLPARLDRPYHGDAAIAALGAHLPAVAQAHRMRADELHTLFRTQRGLAVDRDGELFYVCDAPAVAQPADTLDASYVSAENTSAAGDPFRLHSFPGSTKIIYLDFNGHTTTGTQWNSSSGISSIVSQPFDLDGSPTTWSTAEQDVIRRVWQRVSEDYAPFAVDVTTEDPGVEALRRTSSSDTAYGIRVVISPTNWYNTGAGGVGYLGSFSASSDTPCFAFTGQLANSEGPIAETAAHEAGHTVGLYHDGSSSGEYYAGHGNWAPIMGNSFYKPITQFSRGEYAGANNTQDDLAVIANYVAIAADDHGNTFDTASSLAGPTVSDGGTIERSTDVDVFKFTTSGGTVSLTIQGPSPSPDLDIKAELLSAAGASLQVSDPSTLAASISTTVPSGTYYLRISGVGAGDPVSSGYSNYASVGNYVITGSLPSGTVSTVAPTFTTQPTSQTVNAGSNVTFTASASGTPAPTYQWWKDGVAISGATSSTLSLTNVTTGNAGSYSVVAANSAGSAISSSAVLIVNAAAGASAPSIITQPVSQTATWGSTVQFRVDVSGSPTPSVQWYRNGSTWPGWTGTTLTLYSVTSNDDASYIAVVTNSAGSVTSAPATLTVTTGTSTSAAPAFTTQPVSQTVNAGVNVTFTASASGSPVPGYQWYKDGVAIAGATSSSLTLNAVTGAHAGNYSVVAANSAGSATSGTAVLIVNASSGSLPPTITTQPVSQTATWGSTVQFRIDVGGSPAPSVRWYRNGITWPDWTSSTLTLYYVTSNDDATYTAVVTNSAGTVTSAPATLTVR